MWVAVHKSHTRLLFSRNLHHPHQVVGFKTGVAVQEPLTFSWQDDFVN